MSRKNAKIFAFHRLLCLVAANRLFTIFLYQARKTAGGICGTTAPSAFNLFGDSARGQMGASNGGLFWGPLDGKSQILRVDQISNQLLSDESSWMIWICFSQL